MHAHANPIVWEVRVFETAAGNSNGYERRERPSAVCLARLGEEDGVVFISMLSGKFGRAEMRAVLAEAQKWGAKKLVFRRVQGDRTIDVPQH